MHQGLVGVGADAIGHIVDHTSPPGTVRPMVATAEDHTEFERIKEISIHNTISLLLYLPLNLV